MSNKSKAVIAVCIVAGILGLVIFDLATGPGKTKAAAPDAPEQIVKLTNDPAAPAPAPAPVPAATPEPASPNQVEKGAGSVEEPPAAPAPQPVAAPEEYVVQPGDSVWTIAKAKLGDGKEWKKIVDANPGMNPDKLSAGKKIVIPSKAKPSTAIKGPKEIVGSENSQVYTVQPNDSLSSISTKFFKTVKYAKAIFDANKELIRSPDNLKAGLQILIPQVKDVPAAPATQADPTPEPAPAPAPTASDKRVYKVQSNDSLWKIASKYDARHVTDMIEKIVHANSDKLESEATPLKVGWELVIPQ